MATYIPHTDDEIATMLASLGLTSLDELFSSIPEAIRVHGALELAAGVGEPDALAHLESLADRNGRQGHGLVCFAGGGAYDHEIPSVTRALAGRSEFVTSYTPYQAEVAQGVLQALFEYQTMVARLFGLPLANASLYDGASATVEAVNLGVAASGRPLVWLSEGIHPHWRQVVVTCATGTGHEITTVPLSGGTTRWPAPGPGGPPGVIVVGQPNYLGYLEDLTAARAVCDATGAVLVVAADPVAAGVLCSPGAQGTDVVVGEGQAFGSPLGFGGPYLGLFACREEHVRRLPGRLVGETVDTAGRRAYVTTLRTREQDIRREKATSNVCTNQTLMAITAAIQLAWLGTAGLAEMARRCARATHFLFDALMAIDGVVPYADAPFLRECAVRLPVPAATVVDRMADAGFLAGVDLAGTYDGGDHALLVTATERRTRQEIDAYVAAFTKAVA